MRWRAAWLFALALAAACQLPESGAPHPGVVCTLVAVPALGVAVTDSLTGAAIASAKVVARLEDGSYADSTTASFGGSYSLAYEHAGTYDVTVQAAGYVTWSRPRVVVARTPDGCHVITVMVVARLLKG